MGILGRVASALATSVVLMSASVGAVGALGPAGPDAAAPDPYSTKINTRTVVTTPTPIRTGTAVDISVKVTANSPETPTGEITLRLSPAPGGSGQSRVAAAGPADWTRTIQYDGGTDHVTGPSFPETGFWLVTAVFTPDGNTFRGSRDGWVLEVADGGANPGADDGDDNGLLPDTGGPALLWLLLGVALVGGGAAAVIVARRRRTSVPTTA